LRWMQKAYTTSLFLIAVALIISAGIGVAVLITNALQNKDYNINLEEYPVLQLSLGGLFPRLRPVSNEVISPAFVTPAVSVPPSPTPYATPTINPEIADKHLVNIAGFAFNDVSGDGVYNNGEPRIVNIGFYVYDSAQSDRVILTVYTDSNGNFRNSVYVVGDAIVRPVSSDKYEAITISRTYTTTTESYEFAFKPAGNQTVVNAGVLQGYVFNDVNGSRHRESGESAVYFKNITLRDSSGKTFLTENGTTETNQDGSFKYIQLPVPGTFTLGLVDATGTFTVPKATYTYYLSSDQSQQLNLELPVNKK